MRTETYEKVWYNYNELSESAQENARAKHNQFEWESGWMQESMQLISDGILEEAGLSEAEDLTYSLYSQGGTPKFKTSGPFEHDGQKYTIDVSTEHTGGGYYRGVIELSTEDEEHDWEFGIPEDAQEAAVEFIRGLSNKMYEAFIAEDEYISSDEAFRETAEANDWEFDEEGNL